MGPGAQSVADGIFGLLFIALGALGDNLDKYPMEGYRCPHYCGVDHEHLMGDYGYNTDNRDTGNTSSSSRWLRMGLHVSDKVHNKGCYKRFKRALRDNSEAN